jgi:hypothetical protein
MIQLNAVPGIDQPPGDDPLCPRPVSIRVTDEEIDPAAHATSIS